MRFTGQVRVPEVDHPGVPATFLVDENQAEVLLEGESLGRWSLYDVVVTRLVSSAFSVKLGDEEITFIADEPMDFAYKGAEYMAEAWARYKAMTLPRRMVAVGRSRRDTLPSRIPELRQAMLQNLGGLTPAQSPAPAPVTETPVPSGTVITPLPPSLRAAEPRTVEEEAKATAFRPAPSPPRPPAAAEPEPETATTPPPLRPGAGLYARRVGKSTVEPAPPVSIGPEPVEMPQPPPAAIEPEPVEVPQPPPAAIEPEPVALADLEPDGTHLLEPLPEIEPDVEPIYPFARPGVDAVEPPGPARPEPVPAGHSGDDWWSEEPEDDEPGGEPEEPAEPVPVPELVRELLSTSSDEGEPEGPRDLVVDLGRYEDRDAESGQAVTQPTKERQPALAATAPETERGGLFGAVRSAFVRNRAPHEHEFVEAPGGIGIVRQICAECGYISIGVND